MGDTIRRIALLATALAALCAAPVAIAAEDGGGTPAPPGDAPAPGAATAPAAPAPAPPATTPQEAQPNPPGTAPQPGRASPAPGADDGAIADAAARGAEAGGDAPVALVALGALALVLALATLAWAVVRFFAWEPRWLLGARHSVAEAGWRTSGAWADFTDWVRRGRGSAA